MVWKEQIVNRLGILNSAKKELKEKEIEVYESKRDLDLRIFKKKGNSKTYHGWLIQKIKEARQENNLDVAELLMNCYTKFNEFKEHERVILKGWKGKSGIQIIDYPDYFEVITFQKPNQDEEAIEIKTEITKLEVNRIINVINELNTGEKINTRDIGERAYKREWDKIFADRPLHIQLNLILRILDYYNLTKYRGKYTTVLKPVKEIQELLSLNK